VSGSVVASVSDGSDWIVFKDDTIITRTSGISNIFSFSPSTDNDGPTSATWTVTFSVSAGNDFQYVVQGANGVSIDWVILFSGNYSAG
jgi:hypothetical protein